MPQNSVLNCNPSVYILVQKLFKSKVKILLMTYNEEVLEDITFDDVEEKTVIDESLIDHMCNNLNRKYKLCSGINNELEVSTNNSISKFLIEKYGDTITYRSRNCSR